MDAPYRILPHSQIGELATQVYDLAALAFGSYPGVLQPSRAHREWYVRRPGMSADLSRAAVHDGRLVSSVFVTVARMRLGGELCPVGILDTVMTHPEHRRRGLARRLLRDALEGMRGRGLAASLLYTLEGSMPFRLYEGLGFRPAARVSYWRHPEAPGAPQGEARRIEPREHERVRGLLNDWHAGAEGYVPLDEALWRWRKVERPVELPAEVWLLERDGQPLGTATLCRASIVTEAGASPAWFLTDPATNPKADRRAVLDELLRVVPSGEARALTDADDEDAGGALSATGFRRVAVEAAMVHPMGHEALLAGPTRRWYPLAESIVGL